MKVFELDMAAAVIAATGLRPAIRSRQEAGRVSFTFPDDAAVTDAVARYATNQLMLSARQLLLIRGDLYKQIRRAS
jgi:hypothetical protein